ncbi:Conjugal transfer protein TrbC (plasmid) [Prosthecochloris aestuarii DSM 271]|uniref:Conjugal transfer protein TrbC n=1 Tax=Prosthecochloris aestuarii (strain DSM 271 / SK 413) TaxID=290512 RepID=B4S9L1_PROA2|nr:TrbC/VirB2 family protein [Prosthecochloris aestuarii]ACF47338.1 Conjugal transfer protein TrbC [Prosthecochloris aestuarii DSM 271]
MKKHVLLLPVLILLMSNAAYAASTGMPWEGPLDQLLNSLTGPVSRVIGAVSIISLGLGLAFSEGGGVMRKALWVVMGLAIAYNAVSWGIGFMGFGGGLLV